MNEQMRQEKTKGGLILKLIVVVAVVVAGYLVAQRLMTGESEEQPETVAQETPETAQPAQPASPEAPAGKPADLAKQAQMQKLINSLSVAAQQEEVQNAKEEQAAEAALADVPDEDREIVGKLQEVIGDLNDNPAKRAQMLEFLKVLQEEDENNGEQMSLDELLTRLEGADFNS